MGPVIDRRRNTTSQVQNTHGENQVGAIRAGIWTEHPHSTLVDDKALRHRKDALRLTRERYSPRPALWRAPVAAAATGVQSIATAPTGAPSAPPPTDPTPPSPGAEGQLGSAHTDGRPPVDPAICTPAPLPKSVPVAALAPTPLPPRHQAGSAPNRSTPTCASGSRQGSTNTAGRAAHADAPH